MARYFSQEFLDEIKSRLSIREVVADYVQLKRDGSNWKALCPFHREKTPSFKVHEGKGIFHCFGCGESGNIFTFLMKIEGISFPEAVERLAKRAGLELPKQERKELQKEEEKNAKIYRINQLAHNYFVEKLFSKEGEKAREYLEQRGLKKQDLERFGIGYAPSGWDNLLSYLRGRGVPDQLALEAGLIVEREGGGYYDRFRNRVIFPIRDLLMRVRGFGARVLDDSLPKYINSPESPVYKKGELLYGIELAKDVIRKKDRAIVVEGYFDRIQLALAGFDEAVASLGTAFTSSQARMLARYTNNIYLVFDADEAGRKASIRALEVFLSSGLFPYLVLMPEGYDPDDLIRKQGSSAFEKLLEQAPKLLDWYLESELSKASLDLVRKGEIIRELIRMIGLIPRSLERELYLKKLAQLSGVSEPTLFRMLGRERAPAREKEEAEEKSEPAINLLGSCELILFSLVNNPEKKLAQMLLDKKIDQLVGEPKLAEFFQKICADILADKKVDPAGYFHILTGTRWEQILGRALSEGMNLTQSQILQAVNDAIFHLEKKRFQELEQEINQKMQKASLEGDQKLLMELLEQKSRLIEMKRLHSKAQQA